MQKHERLNFSFLEAYLTDPEFEAETIALLLAMKKALSKRKLKKFNNEDIFNFILMVLCELERLPQSQVSLDIKHKPQLIFN